MFKFREKEVTLKSGDKVKIKELNARQRREVTEFDTELNGIILQATVVGFGCPSVADLSVDEIQEQVPGAALQELFEEILDLSGFNEGDAEKNS